MENGSMNLLFVPQLEQDGFHVTCVDISKVLCYPTGIIGCKFSDCYDQAAHPPTIITIQAWGIPINTVSVMLIVLQTI